MNSEDADVIIIGTGQAGVPLAARLASAGKRVVIVERHRPGGTCVNVGCTPTKTLIASARAAHVARTAARLGVQVSGVQVDFAAVMARKQDLVRRWREGVEHKLASAGENLQLVRGHARFVAPDAIEVNGARKQAAQIVIDVGARPAVPELEGLGEVPYLTSSSALELTTLPTRLMILGAGYIACEMGQMFRRFGAEVTLIAPSARLLPRENEAVSRALSDVFEREGIGLELGHPVRRVRHGGFGVELELQTSDGLRRLSGSHLLLAVGRTPNTFDLGCEAASIALDERGFIVVDERYESSRRGVFAVGDCIPGPQFTHVAWDDHRVLFETLLGRPARPHSARFVPYTIFTDPQVAGVGLSERAAREQHLDVEVARMPFASIARAIETDETAGIVEVVIDAKTERLLGARIVGVDAGELIHVFSVLMQAGVSVRAIVDAEFVHPTFAEGLQTAVMKLPRFALA